MCKMAKARTRAAGRWLTKAKETLDPERYQNLLRHVEKVGQDVRLTKKLCLKALVALWAEEGLPEV